MPSTPVMKRVIRTLAAILTAAATASGQDAPQPGTPQPDAIQPNTPQPEASSPDAPRPDPADLVRALGSELYKEREAATATLWNLGEAGLEELRMAAASTDPEVAQRSRRLVYWIQTGITPATPAEIVELVERYHRSGVDDKKDALTKLIAKKAYVQVLRLYRFEEDPEVRDECVEVIDAAILPAVREELAEDHYDVAAATLLLVPPTDENLRRRAALSRERGRIDRDLAAAGEAGDEAWSLALLRAKGDVPAAIAAARKLGREDVVASLSLFEGDPVPYLDWFAANERNAPTMRLHAEMARDRWLGEEEHAAKLAKSLARNVNDESEDQRSAVVSLMLNGYLDLALPMMRKNDDFQDFLYAYYETVEDPVGAIAVFGYQGTGEEKKKWVEQKLKKLRANWVKGIEDRNVLLTVVSFLMARGERERAVEIAGELAAIVREQEGKAEWLEFLGVLGGMPGTFQEVAFALAAEEMGDDADDDEVAQVIASLFRDDDIARRHWERLKDEKGLTAAERLILLAGVYGMAEVPPNLVETVQKKWFTQAMAAEGEERRQALADLVEPAAYRDDAGAVLRLLELLAEIDGIENWTMSLGIYYGYMGRWEKSAGIWKLALDANPNARQTMAALAAVKMRLGERDEGLKLLKKPVMDSLDEPEWLSLLASIFEMRNLDDEVEGFWRRLLITSAPTSRSRTWISACAAYAEHAKNRRQWRVAAAFMEVEALYDIRDRATSVTPVIFLRKRFGADLMRGLALHEEGKDDEARALFDRSFRILVGDAGLADDFFPLLREAGFTAEHDQYFEEAFAKIMKSIEAYPRTHNTYNSAAWLASRAMRRLDDAQRMVTKALEMRPRQAAYIDTMAEVWFALGDREKAVEWSIKAVVDSENAGHSGVGGSELRRQLKRFETGDFPVP